MKDDAVALFFAFLILGLAGFLLGHFGTESKIQREAIRAGVAYYTNDASGSTQFKWKEVK